MHDLVREVRVLLAVLTEGVHVQCAAEHALVELHCLFRVAPEVEVRVKP